MNENESFFLPGGANSLPGPVQTLFACRNLRGLRRRNGGCPARRYFPGRGRASAQNLSLRPPAWTFSPGKENPTRAGEASPAFLRQAIEDAGSPALLHRLEKARPFRLPCLFFQNTRHAPGKAKNGWKCRSTSIRTDYFAARSMRFRLSSLPRAAMTSCTDGPPARPVSAERRGGPTCLNLRPPFSTYS